MVKPQLTGKKIIMFLAMLFYPTIRKANSKNLVMMLTWNIFRLNISAGEFSSGDYSNGIRIQATTIWISCKTMYS